MKKETVFYTLGLLLIAAALVLTLHNIWADKQAGDTAQSVLEQFPQPTQPRPQPTLPTQPTEVTLPGKEEPPEFQVAPLVPMPVRTIDGREYVGKLTIPSLGLTLPILNEWSYENLNIAPCRFYGSIYQNSMVLCGHNFSSHFGLLRNLRLGDPVIFTDMDGNEFACEVAEIIVLSSGDLEEMTCEQWPLTLFTCDLNRSKRVTVRCRLLP